METKSFLDLINECDNFPYFESNPEHSANVLSSYFKLYLSNGETTRGPYGWLPEWVVKEMPWDGHWAIDYQDKKINPKLGWDHLSSQTEIIRDTLLRAKKLEKFNLLNRWRGELCPIHGSKNETLDTVFIERSASSLFGINVCGVHMTVYTRTNDGLKIWVPRRARCKKMYAGMLDNTVAGALTIRESPLQCLVREAAEEASLSERLIKSCVKACGTVSYIHIPDKQTGLLQPECMYVYEMEVGPDIEPKPPNDTEVENFYLWTVDEVKKHMTLGEFKPNCALVLLDFFVRHGFLTAENEPHYAEIVPRLHRTLPFSLALQ